MPNETFCNYQRQGSSPEESQLAFSTEVLWASGGYKYIQLVELLQISLM